MTGAPLIIDQKTREKIKKGYALYSVCTGSFSELASLSGVTEAELNAALQDPLFLVELEAEYAKAQHDGRLTVVLAQKTQCNLMQVVFEASKTIDISEVPELAKIVSRVLEQADRVRLAEKQTENLQIIQVTFGSDFSINTEVLKPTKTNAAIDVEARSVTTPKPSVQNLGGIEAFNVKLTPLSLDEVQT